MHVQFAPNPPSDNSQLQNRLKRSASFFGLLLTSCAIKCMLSKLKDPISMRWRKRLFTQLFGIASVYLSLQKCSSCVTNGRRQRGQRRTCLAPPLDFHTWCRYSRCRLNSAMFRSFFVIFWSFFRCPSPWKRLNSTIFHSFFVTLPPGKFSADALGVTHNKIPIFACLKPSSGDANIKGLKFCKLDTFKLLFTLLVQVLAVYVQKLSTASFKIKTN